MLCKPQMSPGHHSGEELGVSVLDDRNKENIAVLLLFQIINHSTAQKYRDTKQEETQIIFTHTYTLSLHCSFHQQT